MPWFEFDWKETKYWFAILDCVLVCLSLGSFTQGISSRLAQILKPISDAESAFVFHSYAPYSVFHEKCVLCGLILLKSTARLVCDFKNARGRVNIESNKLHFIIWFCGSHKELHAHPIITLVWLSNYMTPPCLNNSFPFFCRNAYFFSSNDWLIYAIEEKRRASFRNSISKTLNRRTNHKIITLHRVDSRVWNGTISKARW